MARRSEAESVRGVDPDLRVAVIEIGRQVKALRHLDVGPRVA